MAGEALRAQLEGLLHDGGDAFGAQRIVIGLAGEEQQGVDDAADAIDVDVDVRRGPQHRRPRPSGRGSASISRRWERSRIAASGLFTSWAMLALISPSAAIFAALMEACRVSASSLSARSRRVDVEAERGFGLRVGAADEVEADEDNCHRDRGRITVVDQPKVVGERAAERRRQAEDHHREAGERKGQSQGQRAPLAQIEQRERDGQQGDE